MNAAELIRKAKAEGRTALTEAESKEVLRRIRRAGRGGVGRGHAGGGRGSRGAIGFPVVLKGLGARLTHKTERGLVRLNLKDDGEVRQAAAEVAASAGADLEGYLIQPMLSGRREFVAGLFHDAQFGPVVMFGLGGIFTEALDDVVFRIAPVDEKEAGADDRRAPFAQAPRAVPRRAGGGPREQLIRTLIGLSRVGLELPDVTEADINPLLVGPDGRVTAVDALIILGERPAAQAVPSADRSRSRSRSSSIPAPSPSSAPPGRSASGATCSSATWSRAGSRGRSTWSTPRASGNRRPADLQVGGGDSGAGRSGRRDHPGGEGPRSDPPVAGRRGSGTCS